MPPSAKRNPPSAGRPRRRREAAFRRRAGSRSSGRGRRCPPGSGSTAAPRHPPARRSPAGSGSRSRSGSRCRRGAGSCAAGPRWRLDEPVVVRVLVQVLRRRAGCRAATRRRPECRRRPSPTSVELVPMICSSQSVIPSQSLSTPRSAGGQPGSSPPPSGSMQPGRVEARAELGEVDLDPVAEAVAVGVRLVRVGARARAPRRRSGRPVRRVSPPSQSAGRPGCRGDVRDGPRSP